LVLSLSAAYSSSPAPRAPRGALVTGAGSGAARAEREVGTVPRLALGRLEGEPRTRRLLGAARGLITHLIKELQGWPGGILNFR